MQATFDNGSNFLNAKILASHDNGTIYVLKTSFTFLRGRKITVLRDAKPIGDNVVVGAIHWRDCVFEVNGERKKWAGLKRREGNLFGQARIWQWGSERKAYKAVYGADVGWKVFDSEQSEHEPESPATSDEEETKEEKISEPPSVARLKVQHRPPLIKKERRPELEIERSALVEDEVFLILMLIYSETRRRDKTNLSTFEEY